MQFGLARPLHKSIPHAKQDRNPEICRFEYSDHSPASIQTAPAWCGGLVLDGAGQFLCLGYPVGNEYSFWQKLDNFLFFVQANDLLVQVVGVALG
jgi:hypothetical protein